MVNAHHTNANREKIIATQQTSGEPLPLRQGLELALQVANGKRKAAIEQNMGDMWARAWESIKECEEQLVILDAIAYGYIKPAPGCGRTS